MSKASLLVLCHSEKTAVFMPRFFVVHSDINFNQGSTSMIGGYYGMGSRGAQRSRVVPSNEPDFGVERDAEFFMDIVLYGVGECGNVFSGSSSEIGEYKWL